ncbi:hypothetical protein JTE90_001493, partial [Oedothorax gibbosus]
RRLTTFAELFPKKILNGEVQV